MDLYGTLGVPREASADEIKRAYRRLAQAHHPAKLMLTMLEDYEYRFEKPPAPTATGTRVFDYFFDPTR